MAVYYKIYQSNRNDRTKNLWYARAAMVETDGIDALAKNIMEKCTVNEADVIAVIKALISEMTRSLQASHRVKLPGFGTFKIGIHSQGCAERKDFSPAKNIKGIHILFAPELKKGSDGSYTRAFLSGTHVKEMSNYQGTDTEENTTGGDSVSGGDSAAGGDTTDA